jgi:hypothetical protein
MRWIAAKGYQIEIYEREIGLKKGRPVGKLLKKLSSRDREAAEALALAALTFLTADPARLDRFVSLHGLSLVNLRETGAAPGFLAGVLDHLAGDETLLLAFAANHGLDPAEVERAWAILADPPEAG